tara:strand:+ start:5079 stop:5660 length:582 start_codon:yes stop_codon:yes gene_type:complete
MLSYKESLKILKETKALQEGHFILSSGLHSAQYIQCAKLLSNPKLAKNLCISLVEKINKSFKNIDIILSPALGGMIIGYEVARIMGIKNIFAERESGNLVLRRGFELKEKSNVLIVEDVITTGKSAKECSEIVIRNKANLLGYACIIDRSNNNSLIKNKIVSQVAIKIKTFKENEIPEDLKKIQPLKPGSRSL